MDMPTFHHALILSFLLILFYVLHKMLALLAKDLERRPPLRAWEEVEDDSSEDFRGQIEKIQETLETLRRPRRSRSRTRSQRSTPRATATVPLAAPQPSQQSPGAPQSEPANRSA